MNDPLADRSDERIMDDVLACLGIVKPEWFNWMDEPTRLLHVREQLDELEAQARETGRCETGCMVVEYDPAERVMRWSVLVAYRYENDACAFCGHRVEEHELRSDGFDVCSASGCSCVSAARRADQ